MSTAVYLTLHNPSPTAARGGIVVTPWKGIADRGSLDPDALVLFDGQEMAAQVDRLDPNDPSHDELVFRLPDGALSPGDEDYSTADEKKLSVSQREVPAAPENKPVSIERHATGLNLRNDVLDIYLNTVAESPSGKGHEDKKWFAGAFTSVQLHQFEMLDPVAADSGWYEHHHKEKRIQVDRVHLVRPPWDKGRSVDFELFRDGWSVESVSVGPLRATVTIASKKYEFTCRDADEKKPKIEFDCWVYRAVSLYPDQEWFSEKIWVKAKRVGSDSPTDMWFRPRYFMLTNLSLRPDEFRYPDHPGWFAIISEQGYGYAFATDALAGPIWRPPLDHPDGRTRHRAFEWELGQTRYAHAIHLFHRQATRTSLASRIGDIWYNFCFKPIWAKLPEKGNK